MSKLWSIQTTEYGSVLKGNELSGHEKTWWELTCMLLSERSQPEKTEHCTIPTTWHLEKADYGTVKSSAVAGG